MNKFKIVKTAAFLAAAVLLVPHAWARSRNDSVFKYVAGTEPLPEGCAGKLEVTGSNLVFQCAEQSLAIPYGAITQMEFLPQVSKRIRKMKLAWAIKPTSARGKHDGFFTVLYTSKGQTRAIILKTRNDTMRPYMAEIDLKTGRPIESRRD
ncbi:MAG: hypothetical protein EPN47_14695 [Acidobacteria bacterium]|nr:MAG: hypothetical protein EPN47_14695 [Acidobacteriota bacterium]